MSSAAVLAPLVCAGAALLGVRAARALCRNVEPFGDGPEPIAYRNWPFLAIGALCGIGVAMRGTDPYSLVIAASVVALLATCCACDLARGLLPDAATLGLIVLAVALGAVRSSSAPLLGALAIALPFAVLALLTRGRGMGWGDVKLAAAGGALLGAEHALVAYVLAAVVAFAIAWRAGTLQRPIPFGAYLACAIAVMFSARAVG